MNQRQNDFIRELLFLLGKYNADLMYTNDDDGVHLIVDGEDIGASYSWGYFNIEKLPADDHD